MRKHKNTNWLMPDTCTLEQAQICVLMDLRDSLIEITRQLVALTGQHSTQIYINRNQETHLRLIRKQTKKRKYSKRVAL